MYSRIIADLFTTAEGEETRSISTDISEVSLYRNISCVIYCVYKHQ